MFDAKFSFRSQLIPAQLIPAQLYFLAILTLILPVAALCPSALYATVQNVTAYGAKGDGMTDDTTAIHKAIAALQPGDTLYFPCTTGGSTYLITSQLTISLNNGVPLSNVTVAGDPSGCVALKDEYGGPNQQAILLIGGDSNGNPNPSLGPAVSLSTTTSELATSFTTSSSLAVGVGDYVYLCEGGVGGNSGGTSTVCGTANSLTVTCDPSGCRGEVVKVASVSGNTITVTTALHDTYVPSPSACATALTGNCATAQKILNPLVGVTVQNLTFNGTGTAFPHVVDGLALAGVGDSTVSGVTSMNVQGSAIMGNGNFNVAWNNITVTGAGSDLCGSAVWFQNQGNLLVSGLSVSQENTVGGGVGCAANDAFGFELITAANSAITDLSIDATSASGRPFKTTAARWNTFDSPTVQNGNAPNTYDNGISVQYYSAHNTYNSCVVKNNGAAGTGTGSAGINLFGNYNQYNTFNNCTVSGNGNIQFFDQNGSDSGHQTDSHNTISSGSFTGTNATESVVLIQADSSSVYGATLSGPGWYGIELDAPATNACVNNNIFTTGSTLSGSIDAGGSNDVGSGNQLNNLTMGGNFNQGTCGNNFGYAAQGASVGTTMSNTITASRYQVPSQSGTVTSISVFIASPVSVSPNNQFQVAIYADNNGTPGALIASSASQTIAPDAWNTVLINAPVTASANYWLAYNTNGLTGNANNLRYDTGGTMLG